LRGDDAFCRIARGEEKAYVAYSDDYVMVILDRSPICKGHLLVISRDHYEGVDSAPPEVVSRAFLVAAAVARYLRERLGAPRWSFTSTSTSYRGGGTARPPYSATRGST